MGLARRMMDLELAKLLEELEAARQRFNSASDPYEIDAAIFEICAAERRISALLAGRKGACGQKLAS